MKYIIITVLALIMGVSAQAQEYRITKENAKDFRINGEKFSELGVDYIAINGIAKAIFKGGFNMTIDVGDSYTIWTDDQITMDGKEVFVKSPMFILNLFIENGYELVSSEITSLDNVIVVQYILHKKKE